MFGMFRKSPLKKMEQDHEMLLTKAFNAQRNGDIRQYSTLTAEAEEVRKRIENQKSERGE